MSWKDIQSYIAPEMQQPQIPTFSPALASGQLSPDQAQANLGASVMPQGAQFSPIDRWLPLINAAGGALSTPMTPTQPLAPLGGALQGFGQGRLQQIQLERQAAAPYQQVALDMYARQREAALLKQQNETKAAQLIELARQARASGNEMQAQQYEGAASALGAGVPEMAPLFTHRMAPIKSPEELDLMKARTAADLARAQYYTQGGARAGAGSDWAIDAAHNRMINKKTGQAVSMVDESGQPLPSPTKAGAKDYLARPVIQDPKHVYYMPGGQSTVDPSMSIGDALKTGIALTKEEAGDLTLMKQMLGSVEKLQGIVDDYAYDPGTIGKAPFIGDITNAIRSGVQAAKTATLPDYGEWSSAMGGLDVLRTRELVPYRINIQEMNRIKGGIVTPGMDAVTAKKRLKEAQRILQRNISKMTTRGKIDDALRRNYESGAGVSSDESGLIDDLEKTP